MQRAAGTQAGLWLEVSPWDARFGIFDPVLYGVSSSAIIRKSIEDGRNALGPNRLREIHIWLRMSLLRVV